MSSGRFLCGGGAAESAIYTAWTTTAELRKNAKHHTQALLREASSYLRYKTKGPNDLSSYDITNLVYHFPSERTWSSRRNAVSKHFTKHSSPTMRPANTLTAPTIRWNFIL
jgi:carbonic anhydrase